MKLETKKLSEIKPYWRNARKNERAVEAVKDSIIEYGYVAPIVVDTEMVIIAGHTRYKALTQLNYKEASVIVSDMDKQKAKEYRIIDNKTSELSTWDTKLLIPELREFRNLDKFTLHFPELTLPKLDPGAGSVASMPSVKYDINNEDVNDAETKLANQFTAAAERFEQSARLITCPHCDEAFEAVYAD